MAGFQDWLTVTDQKLLAETLAEQFRLSQNELEKAQAALQPAFALGLEKAMASPAAWSDLARAFAAMAPGDGTALPGIERGRAFMDTVFGSDALIAAIARQASLFAGIAPDTLQKMMPGLAMLSMETMMRQAMAHLARHQPAGLAAGDIGGATAEMMRRGASAMEALGRPSGAPGPNPAGLNPAGLNPAGLMPRYFADAFTAALKQGMAWMPAAPEPAPTRATPRQEPAPDTANPMLPFAAMFGAFAEGMQGAIHGGAPASPPAPGSAAPDLAAATATPDGDAAPSGEADGMVADLLRSGQKLQTDYTRQMAALFERYQGASKPN